MEAGANLRPVWNAVVFKSMETLNDEHASKGLHGTREARATSPILHANCGELVRQRNLLLEVWMLTRKRGSGKGGLEKAVYELQCRLVKYKSRGRGPIMLVIWVPFQLRRNKVKHLDFWKSDHRSIILEMADREGQSYGGFRFHYESAWAEKNDFPELVKNSWATANGSN
ncbi:hypothetical protein QYF36_016638 [Acer negundo]|nr:hypothetical protein QYF36_016638 [Acer negundo]